MNPRARYAEYALAAAFTILLLGVVDWCQPATTFNGGLGWDDVVYHDLAERIARGEPLQGPSPFVYRVGLPFLAAKLAPGDLRFGFLVVSYVCIALTSVAFVAWLTRFLTQRWVRVLCLVAFVTQFHAMPRFIPFRNFMVDAPATLAACAGLLLIEKWRERPGWLPVASLALCTVVGVWVRESAFIPAVAFLLTTEGPGDRRQPQWQKILPLACGVISYLLLRKSISASGGSLSLQLIGAAMMAKAKLPMALPLGCLLTFGPLLVLPALAARSSARFLGARLDLALALCLFTIMGWAGGSDTERLLYYAAPIVFVLIGLPLNDLDPKRELVWLVPLLLLQTISSRWYWRLPDHGPVGGFPLLTVIGPHASYESVWSAHMARALRGWLLLQHALVFAAFYAWLRSRQRRGVTPRFDLP